MQFLDTANWLINPAILASYLLVVVVIEITPGPNMGYLAALTMSRGRTAGFMTIVGITLAFITYMLVATLGLAEVFLIHRPLYEALRWAGVFYMLWLAWESWVESADSVSEKPSTHSWLRLAGRGFLTNILNPKAAVFYIALLPSFIAEDRGHVAAQSLILGCTHIAVSIVVHLSIVLLAAHAMLMGGGINAKRRVLVTRVLAVFMACIALWLAFETHKF